MITIWGTPYDVELTEDKLHWLVGFGYDTFMKRSLIFFKYLLKRGH